MDNVLYEVAVLTRHTQKTVVTHTDSPAPGAQWRESPMLYTEYLPEHVVELNYKSKTSIELLPGTVIPPGNKLLSSGDMSGQFSNDFSYLQGGPGARPSYCFEQSSECFSGVSEYHSAQECVSNGIPATCPPYVQESFLATEDSSAEVEDSQAVSQEETSEEAVDSDAVDIGSFMGLLAQKLEQVGSESEVDLYPTDCEAADCNETDVSVDASEMDKLLGGLTNGEEPEDYFSASSSQIDEMSMPGSGRISRSSSSGHGSRSSSIGNSRSSSVNEDIDITLYGSDDNFADVDSFEKSMPFSARRKKQLRMRKGKTALATIFSPAPLTMSAGTKDLVADDEIGSESQPRCLHFESDFSDSGAAYSGGYHGNSAMSDDGNTTEGSVLNPLCSPFVPRAMKEFRFSSSASDSDVPSGNQNDDFGSIPAAVDSTCNDSGFQTNVTTDQSSIISSNQTANESAFFSGSNLTGHEVNELSIYNPPTLLSDISEMGLPEAMYDCKVKHDKWEFSGMSDFCMTDLPLACQSQSSWDTIRSVSKRVVKLCVTGTSDKHSDETSNPDHCQHFGTGFAYFVGRETVEIRSHLKIVSSPQDAENAQVIFNVDGIEIQLCGLADGFLSNQSSQTCVFKCKTTPRLLQHLDNFEDFPIYRRGSVYDSAYSTDTSADLGTDTETESSGSSYPTDLTTLWDLAEDVDYAAFLPSELIDELNSLDLVSNDCIYNGTGTSSEACSPCAGVSYLDNRLAYSLADEKAIKTAFESVAPFEHPSTPVLEHCSAGISDVDPSPYRGPSSVMEHLADLDECPSPLRIMEKRSKRQALKTCPYADQSPFQSIGEYTCFSSFSGDVIAASLPSFPAPVSLSPLCHPVDDVTGWEYEGLVHAQTHLTAQYRNWCAAKENTAAAAAAAPTLDVERPTGSWLDDFVEENYLESWDKNLLNMDDDLNTLPPFGVSENVRSTKVNDACCPRYKSDKGGDSFAVIVSHVHGGEKVVSCGKFSAHAHLGGDLYDTPTCMGSCGAPIIAVGSGDAPAYVSHLVHAGTGRVNDVHSGIGVAYFDEGLATQQTRNVWF